MRHLRKNYKLCAPTPTVTPSPQVLVVGFRPNPTKDTLVEAFSSIGYCVFCYTNADPRDMVLCQCGDVMCTKCFLGGVPCSVGPKVDGLRPPVPKGRISPADFVTTGVASGYINLDGEIRLLQITLETPRNRK